MRRGKFFMYSQIPSSVIFILSVFNDLRQNISLNKAATLLSQRDDIMHFEYKFICLQSNFFSCDSLCPRERSLMNYLQIVQFKKLIWSSGYAGLSTALVEKDDFASGTSSRSTKLIHGGVRYLQKAIMKLDFEQVIV